MTRAELVQRYLQFLEFDDNVRNFTFLEKLIAKHVATFTFSSVGCQLGDDLPLDFKSLFERIIVQRRGGYCFEHNGIFFEILEELGFSPEQYLARVIYNQDIHPGLTHRITLIEYEGRQYILDVGFGPHGPRIPVPMDGSETKDRNTLFRIAKQSGDYHMQILKDGEFFSLYRFELSRYGQADCELGHFYSHKHPDAVFVNNLVVSRILEKETRSLRNLEYWVISDGDSEKVKINSAEQLHGILVNQLGLLLSRQETKELFEKFHN